MITTPAFFLTAGFGTRFKPQTNFLPKPAIPFFNLPQALYPAALLKKIGVSQFYYNSHHLPQELNNALFPFFKRESIFEKEILDSAGGIANAKSFLKDAENFWVVNGDSFVCSLKESALEEAFHFHKDTKSIATLIGVEKPSPELNALCFDQDNVLTHTSRKDNGLHFIGFYIFNKEIFNFLKPQKSHILKDVILNKMPHRVSVYNATQKLTWKETGNESDFISASLKEAHNILSQKEMSAVVDTHQTWSVPVDKKLEQFLATKIWGPNSQRPTTSDFLIAPDNFTGSLKNLRNSVLLQNLDLPAGLNFENRVLIHSSQWA